MRTIDCRTMACPMPVVMVKRALQEDSSGLRVLLEGGAPRENVTRYAKNQGYDVSESVVDGVVALEITAEKEGFVPAQGVGEAVVLVVSDRMGDGPEELGRLLMKNFIITLLDCSEVPGQIFFLNTGVLLTTEGSEVLEVLNTMEKAGVGIFSCGVCLDYFGRKDGLKAGKVTNMFTIAEALLHARTVLRP